jgi:SAM-dependent methyltransferase
MPNDSSLNDSLRNRNSGSQILDEPWTYDCFPELGEFYDHVIPYQTRQDVGFFVEEAKNSGGEVLEIGCGTGRIMIPTARAGISITGIDRSKHMLERLAVNLSHEPDDVRTRVAYVESDMRNFELGKQFSLITIPFRPFQHLLTTESQLACLECIRRHLAPGGRLIIDVFNPSLSMLAETECGVEFAHEPEFVLPDGRRVNRCARITRKDLLNQINYCELIYRVTDKNQSENTIVHPFGMRYYFRYELEHLLARAGFQIMHLYSDYDRSAFGAKYPGELLAIATPC